MKSSIELDTDLKLTSGRHRLHQTQKQIADVVSRDTFPPREEDTISVQAKSAKGVFNVPRSYAQPFPTYHRIKAPTSAVNLRKYQWNQTPS